MRLKTWKKNKLPRSLKNMNFGDQDEITVGDLVEGDFENEFVMTFNRASENYLGSLQGDGPLFHRCEVGLVLDLSSAPDSFYSSGFCKLLISSGEVGWLPYRWLKLITRAA